jgi:hypothetical protein
MSNSRDHALKTSNLKHGHDFTPQSPRRSHFGALLALPALLLLTSALPAKAQVALAGKASTLGLGAELHVGLNPNFNVRLGANQYTYSDRREESGIEYDAEAKLRSATLILDWFPLSGGFHLTGGLVRNDTHVDGESIAPDSGVYIIGRVPVPVALVGTLQARVEFDQQVPYAGLGWGNPIGSGRKLSFYFDLGVVFQGEPQVRLTPNLPSGSPLNDPVARQALEILLQAEARELEADLEKYDKYPVVALGLAYRF